MKLAGSGGSGRRLYTCHKFDCDFETFEPLKKCPRCGFPLYDAQTFKLLGGLLIFLGAVLAALGGAGLMILVVYKANGPAGGIFLLVYALLTLLTLMGVTVLIGGIKQAVTGHKSSGFMYAFVVQLIVVAVIAAIFKLAVAIFS